MEDDDDDVTILEDEDTTNSAHAFDLFATAFSLKLTALKHVARTINVLTPLSAHYLALALQEALSIGHDLLTLLQAISNTSPVPAPATSTAYGPAYGQSRRHL
ncbi:MAG: hypothetical protein JWM82_3127 [Myxococcales bacterium]|nr:hypothetical protein [Myxococcales bacterium]